MKTHNTKPVRVTRMPRKRRPAELPAAIARDGWQYHHLGIPHKDPRPGEQHLHDLGLHVRGFETSPCGIEWMRFEPQCQVPDVVTTVPHVAFVVDDLDEALKGKTILIAPTAPSRGVRVAFILDDGAPVELLEFEKAASRSAKTNSAAEHRFTSGFLRAFEDLDMPRFIECFTNDATVYFPLSELPGRVEGKPAIRAHFEQVFAAIRQAAPSGPPYHRLVADEVDVQALGTNAAVVSFHLRSADRLARRTLVLTRDNGRWRIVHLHASNVTLT